MNLEIGRLEFIGITIGDMQFTARVEWSLSPITCREFCAILPFRAKLVQARWSGEAAWIPLADFDLKVPQESVTGDPVAGEMLFHPADHSECEILLPYGNSVFRCKHGPLVGNRFLTIVEGIEQLASVGELVLWHGKQDITFRQIG